MVFSIKIIKLLTSVSKVITLFQASIEVSQSSIFIEAQPRINQEPSNNGLIFKAFL